MIDLKNARTVLYEALDLIEKLDGAELDETSAIANQSKGDLRKQRAQLSQDLQLLASRCELAAGLARVEYWHARGHTDPLDPERI